MVGLMTYEKVLKDGVARGKTGNGRPAPPGTAAGDLWQDVVIYEMSYDNWMQKELHKSLE